MKNPDAMSEAELRKYVKHLLAMIHTLQATVRKLSALHPSLHGPDKGTAVKD